MSGKSIPSQIQKWLSAFLVLAAGEQAFADHVGGNITSLELGGTVHINGTISVIAVPEPGRALLLIFSFVGLTLKRSRSRQHRR